MKHKPFNRALAALLSVFLIIGLLPTAAAAAGPTVLNVNGTSILTADGNKVACGNGIAEYDPESNTLTLTDATIEGEFDGHAAIFTDGDLIIRLIGNNTIISGWYGVYSNNNNSTFTICGNGTLAIYADNDCVRGADIIIGTAGETQAPTINVTGTDGYASGMYATKTLTIKNGAKIYAEGGKGYALCGEYGLSIADSEVRAITTDPETNTIASFGDASIINSKVSASSGGYPAIFVQNNIDIENTELTASAAADVAVYSPVGIIRMTDSVVKAQAPLDKYTLYGAGGVSLTGTWLDNVGNEAYLNNAYTIENCVIIDYNAGTVVGNPVIRRDVELSAGIELTVPENTSLTMTNGITFRNNGTVVLKGSFVNDNATVLCADTSHAGGTATCTAKAICSICGAEYGDLGSDNHVNLIAVPAKAATCTAAGNNEYWYCSGCKKYFGDATATSGITSDSTILPVNGHKIDVRYVRPATCELEGNSGELYCTVCGQIISTNNIIPKLGHSFVDGICIVCGAIDPDYAEAPYISKGAGSTWITGSTVDLEFTSTAEFAGFISVWVDGEALDASYYTVREGSTIVTLKASYLDTLSFGKHTIGVVSTNGTAQADFYVTDEGEEITVEDPVEGKTVNSVTENVGGSATTVTAILVMISAALAIYKIKA